MGNTIKCQACDGSGRLTYTDPVTKQTRGMKCTACDGKGGFTIQSRAVPLLLLFALPIDPGAFVLFVLAFALGFIWGSRASYRRIVYALKLAASQSRDFLFYKTDKGNRFVPFREEYLPFVIGDEFALDRFQPTATEYLFLIDSLTNTGHYELTQRVLEHAKKNGHVFD